MTYEREMSYLPEQEVEITTSLIAEKFDSGATLEENLSMVDDVIEGHNILFDTPLRYGRGGHHIWVSYEESPEDRILIIKEEL